MRTNILGIVKHIKNFTEDFSYCQSRYHDNYYEKYMNHFGTILNKYILGASVQIILIDYEDTNKQSCIVDDNYSIISNCFLP